MEDREVILFGDRVVLGAMTTGDQPHFHEWHKNPELKQLIDDESDPSMEDQMEWFARSQWDDRRMFSLLTMENHTLMGHGGFVDIDHGRKNAQFRITIGNPDFWGHGYGTEASRLIVRYGFEELGLHSVWLEVLQDNERAVKSYEKVGFHTDTDIAPSSEKKLRMRITPEKLL